MGIESFKVEVVIDNLGLYSILVDGDYEDDICEIVLVKNLKEDCFEILSDIYIK